MDDDRRRFEGNMARFFDVKPNGDGKTLDIGAVQLAFKQIHRCGVDLFGL